ncbi:MAG: ROK family protein [Firmicutes bacterium]|nr:ROK family protein [Bacillota bacterium]
MGDLVVGVDLGGTKILAVLADREGQVLARIKVPTEADLGREHVITKMAEIINGLLEESAAPAHRVAAVGVGIPGWMDPQQGFLFFAPNLGWKDLPLGTILGERLARPVYLDNDANLAALGEYVYGSGRGTADMVYITVSTGVGGGLILNGGVYHGSMGTAGEIGHITVDPNGPVCRCGNAGCLEAVASGTAMAIRALALVDLGRGAGILAAAGGRREQVNARAVSRAAAAGDAEALVILRDAGRYLGITVAGIINLLNPAAVVLGGGAMQSGTLLWDAMLDEVRRRTLESSLAAVRVQRAALGGDSGAMGAVALAIDRLGPSPARC